MFLIDRTSTGERKIVVVERDRACQLAHDDCAFVGGQVAGSAVSPALAIVPLLKVKPPVTLLPLMPCSRVVPVMLMLSNTGAETLLR